MIHLQHANTASHHKSIGYFNFYWWQPCPTIEMHVILYVLWGEDIYVIASRLDSSFSKVKNAWYHFLKHASTTSHHIVLGNFISSNGSHIQQLKPMPSFSCFIVVISIFHCLRVSMLIFKSQKFMIPLQIWLHTIILLYKGKINRRRNRQRKKGKEEEE